MGEIFPRPEPKQALEFDGERFTTSFSGQTAIEHWHRYLLARELARDRDVLDIACGEGYGSSLLAQTARNVVGVDLSKLAIDHAQRSYGSTNLQYMAGSASAIPLQDDSVDMVVSFETLEHFYEHDLFFREVKRVLKPDGLLLISTPDRDTYSPSTRGPNPYHRHELTREEFLDLVRRHFAEVSSQGQRVLLGSMLLSEGPAADESTPLCFERRGDAYFETSAGLARATYVIALASDKKVPVLPASAYIDTDQLLQVDGPLLERLAAGHPSPEAAARIEDLERVLRQRDEDLMRERNELARTLGEFNRVLGELDRVQETLRQRTNESAELQGRLDAVVASASWRWTTPLRHLAQVFRGRSSVP